MMAFIGTLFVAGITLYFAACAILCTWAWLGDFHDSMEFLVLAIFFWIVAGVLAHHLLVYGVIHLSIG